MDRSGTDDSQAALLVYLSGFVTEHKLRVFDERLRERTRHLTVVLEDIFRPHNASACLRSCDAFGVQDVHIIENRYRFRPNKDIERGSARWLTLHRHNETGDNTPQCIARLRERGYRIVAACPHGQTVPLEEFDVSRPAALFFGTEAEGLSPGMLAAADERVRIPTYGFAESLNISVAVAVSMHHLSFRLRQSDVDWRLPPAEMAELRLAWVRTAIGKRRLPAIEAAFRNKSGKWKAESG